MLKFKDVDILFEMLSYSPEKSDIVGEEMTATWTTRSDGGVPGRQNEKSNVVHMKNRIP